MSATKTEAFVLKTQDYRDTSLLAEFYTRDHGKIRGIIKGVRDARGSYGSTLEPFSLNEILFYRRRRGGDLHQVTQVDLLDPFQAVREDLDRLGYASYVIELLNRFVEVEDPTPELFHLLRDTLEFMAAGSSPRRAARIFEIKFFGLLGLMPEMTECVVCRTRAFEGGVYFSVALGGIHCRGCRAGEGGGTSVPLSKGALNFFGHVRRSSVKVLEGVKVSQEVGEELEKALRRFVDYHLSYPLKSVLFLQKLGIT